MSTRTHPPAPPRISYSPRELARATGLGLTTVRRRLASGDIAFVRCGHRLLIPASEFDRLSLRRGREQCEQFERFKRRLESVRRTLADLRTRVGPGTHADPRDIALVDSLEREIEALTAELDTFEQGLPVPEQGVA